MLDLTKYQSIGAALKDALDRFAEEICLIEADREREKERLTYHEFKERGLALAKALQESGFKAGDRASIIMSNQSKWLISAFAILYSGGVLVPLDYKLYPEECDELWRLLRHSGAKILVTEYAFWRLLGVSALRAAAKNVHTVLITEAPVNAELSGALRWETQLQKEGHGSGEPAFVPRERKDIASIVYSSGTGGTPKGCMATHEAYLEQAQAISQVISFAPGIRYFSILPTNHVVDFMMGFFMPFLAGATVVHLRTLRPEFIREAFARYKITYMMLVPRFLENFQKNLETTFAALPKPKRAILNALIAINRILTFDHPRVWLSRRLLPQVHRVFGRQFRAFGVGSAFIDPASLQFFRDLGIPVANSYGQTEAGAALTVNDPANPREDTVGKPLPGVELRIVNPNSQGIGEVAVRSKTVMAGYLNEPELTAETIVDGWLMTGDLGRLDSTGHLLLLGRKKNMIVTPEGKNVIPEDIESVFKGLAVKEFCVFAANYIWPQRSMTGEQLVLVIHLEPGQTYTEDLRRDISARNNRLLNFKRIYGVVLCEGDFPCTASLKIKRNVLAERLAKLDRASAILPL
jgi:long-chain acyl-CoA synthetase